MSISGHAEMIDDRERVKKYWSVYDKAFWPDKNDPRIRVLRVTPESAEFWEGSGKIVTRSNWPRRIASGERMDLGENEKVWISSWRQARRLKLEARLEARAIAAHQSRRFPDPIGKDRGEASFHGQALR